MGSEFSFEDLSNGSVEKFNFDLLSESESEWVLKRVSKKRSGYSKQVMKISKKYSNPVEVEYYNQRRPTQSCGVFHSGKNSQLARRNF